MPFVKLDTGILNSTLWVERECRELFLTALLMAEPWETLAEMPQISVRSLDYTGWIVPPGWYGFVPAAGVGIIRRAIMDQEVGLAALERLGYPDPESRSSEFEGRRLVRVDGGYIVLNYMKYRERDYTAAERSRRYREKKKSDGVTRDISPLHRDITQAEVEVDAEVDKKEKRSAAQQAACPPVVIEILPLRAGKTFAVTKEFLAELEPLYPAVDITATLREMKGWCVGNPERQKTLKGIRRFIANWLRQEQEKHGG